jgi:DNA (cytosine-5)-methyltransferase 1
MVEKVAGGRWAMALPDAYTGVDLLDSSPPCSSYTPSGSREKGWGVKKKFREGQAKQVLNDLFYTYLELVGRLRPKVSLAENVTGMLLGNAKGYVKSIFERYRALGYLPQLFQVNAADCGVPQARRRVFFLAVREDYAEARGLKPIHLDTPWFQRRHVSTTAACADVEALTPQEVEETRPVALDLRWWHLTRPGENYASAIQRAGLPNAAWNWIRHPAHRPACTLTTYWRCHAHWSECRKLTYREYVRLGSFPDDYWAKSHELGRYVIGMSVPPRMAEAVARAVCEQWLGVVYPAASG